MATLKLLSFLVLLYCVYGSNLPGLQTMPGGGHQFSLPVSRKENANRDFARDWIAGRQKWGSNPLDKASSTFALGDSNGHVDVNPIGSDDIFIADVEIGNPPQLVKMALDTGSSDVWMQSSDTIYRVNQNGPWPLKYRPSDSTSSRLLNSTIWNVQYLDGTNAHGIVYEDTIRLAGFEVTNATIESAQRVASRFETEVQLSGIMGLAKSLPNNILPPMPSFLQELKDHLKEPVFTVDLHRNSTGRFDFGMINQSLAMENITWLDSDPSSPHWDVELDLTSWTGNGKTWWYYPFKATIDTGTTLMFMPDELASMYWFDVPGVRTDGGIGGSFTFPCSGAKDLPDLMFKLPGSEHVLTIPGVYMNYGPVSPSSDYCWGGMQSAQGLDVTVLGDIMLKALFVAFDLDKNRVGFANKHIAGIR